MLDTRNNRVYVGPVLTHVWLTGQSHFYSTCIDRCMLETHKNRVYEGHVLTQVWLTGQSHFYSKGVAVATL